MQILNYLACIIARIYFNISHIFFFIFYISVSVGGAYCLFHEYSRRPALRYIST